MTGDTDTGAEKTNMGGDSGVAAFSDIEATARRAGWKPREEYKGPDDKWVDAATFVERSFTELPILRERYRVLDDRYSALENSSKHVKDELSQVKTSLNDTLEVLSDFRERSQREFERGYKQAKKDLERKHDEAVNASDPAAAREAMQELADLEAEKQRRDEENARRKKAKEDADKAATDAAASGDGKAPPAQPQPNPVVDEWERENDWFKKDRTLNMVAVAIHGELLDAHPDWTLKKNLSEVTKEIQRRFPEKFENQRRNGPGTVGAPAAGDSGGGGNRGGKKGRTFDDLPDEAKEACKKYERTMVKDKKTGKMVPMMTRQEYLDAYDWD